MDRAQASRFCRVGRALRSSARDLAEVAEGGDVYGNAIAIVAIHAAIAYGDALTIAYGGVRSTSGSHEDLVDLLKDVLPPRAVGDEVVGDLGALLRMKDRVSYQGSYFKVSDAVPMIERLDRFSAWAEQMYDARS